MPLNYPSKFGRAGAVAGGVGGAAAGLGLMEGLGNLLAPLDYPRQYLMEAMGLPKEGSEIVRLMGRSLGYDDVPDWLAGAGGFGLEMVTDPLNLIPAGALGHLGAKALGGAARRYGGHLENVARTLGPRFGGTNYGKVQGILGSLPDDIPWTDFKTASGRLHDMWNAPEADRLFAEIPPGSKYLDAGAEGSAYLSPQRTVVRIGGGPNTLDVRASGDAWATSVGAPAPRVDAPLGVPALRSTAIGPYRVEHLPFVKTLGKEPDMALNRPAWEAWDAMNQEYLASHRPFHMEANRRGFKTQDIHEGNVGWTPEGRMVVLDPGSIDYLDPFLKPPEQFTPTEPGMMDSLLLRLLKPEREIRREIGHAAAQEALRGRGIHPDDFLRLTSTASVAPSEVIPGFSHLPTNVIGEPDSRLDKLLSREFGSKWLDDLQTHLGGWGSGARS